MLKFKLGCDTLDALGTLRGGCHRLSFFFILRRESGHQPLVVPTSWGTDAYNVKTLWRRGCRGRARGCSYIVMANDIPTLCVQRKYVFLSLL